MPRTNALSTPRYLVFSMFSRSAWIFSAFPAALAATIDVAVGLNGTLTYTPSNITANVGDVVNLIFHPKNHTATQVSFAEPCVPLSGGIDSGFVPVASENSSLPSFQFTVNDTNPIWVSCQQTGHCGKGMVFSVNAPPDPAANSFDAFRAKAIQINGTTNATSTTSSSASTFTPPPPQSVVTVTATVTLGTSTWTTTYGSYEGTPPPTPAAAPQNHLVIVGDDNKLVFNPSNVSASIGDTITFQFRPKNHTVTQSSFEDPCVSLTDTSTTGQVGFDSGFNPVSTNATTFPTFNITINDTAPIWVYCRQTGHCGQGMVFAANAVADGPNNFAAFQQLAKQLNGTSTSSSTTSTASASASSGSSGSKSSAPITATISTSFVVAFGFVVAVFSLTA